jgi:hypothetical protein
MVNETFVEAKMCTFTLESPHFVFNKCPIYTHDGASAKFSTNSQEMDYSVSSVIGQFSSVSFSYWLCISTRENGPKCRPQAAFQGQIRFSVFRPKLSLSLLMQERNYKDISSSAKVLFKIFFLGNLSSCETIIILKFYFKCYFLFFKYAQ